MNQNHTCVLMSDHKTYLGVPQIWVISGCGPWDEEAKCCCSGLPTQHLAEMTQMDLWTLLLISQCWEKCSFVSFDFCLLDNENSLCEHTKKGLHEGNWPHFWKSQCNSIDVTGPSVYSSDLCHINWHCGEPIATHWLPEVNEVKISQPNMALTEATQKQGTAFWWVTINAMSVWWVTINAMPV